MTAPSGSEPSTSTDAVPADDPEWVKDVVAKALLHATNDETGLTATPPTPAVRASGQWPAMQTTLPDFSATAAARQEISAITVKPVSTTASATLPTVDRSVEQPSAESAPVYPAESVTAPAPAVGPDLAADVVAQAPAVVAPPIEPPPIPDHLLTSPPGAEPPPSAEPEPAPTYAPPVEAPVDQPAANVATPVAPSIPTPVLEAPVVEAPVVETPVVETPDRSSTPIPDAPDAPSLPEMPPSTLPASATAQAPQRSRLQDALLTPDGTPVTDTAQVEKAIIQQESGLPAGVPDRRSESVPVASGGRMSDDLLMEEADATTEGFRTSDLRTILEWLAVIVAALAVALLIKAFVLQAFWIPSVSMETTVNKGDRILVNKVSYNLHEVRRGDLVVFKKLPGASGSTEDLIKRAIALPGETIEVREDGRLWIWQAGETPADAKRLEEPYLSPNNAFISIPNSPNDQGAFGNVNCVNGESPTRCTLDDNSYFMMGDNRTQSADSRSFGPVPEENIVGRAFLRIWPLSDIDTL